MVAPLVAATLLFGVILAAPAAAETIAGPARVIDGDTIAIEGTRIRLLGIDAPELNQECRRSGGTVALLSPCGRNAKTALEGIIGGAVVRCQAKGRDRYGRIVATCTAAGRDIGRELVREGWAVAYTRYSRAYVSDEEAAKAAKVGLWSGVFEVPAEWRARREHR